MSKMICPSYSICDDGTCRHNGRHSWSEGCEFTCHEITSILDGMGCCKDDDEGLPVWRGI